MSSELRRRAGHGLRRHLALFVLAVLLPASVSAQVDTLRTPPPDTATAQDTAVPPPRLVRLSREASTDRALGIFHWGRDALLASTALTLLDLLEQVPGLTTVRSGLVLQPEIATAFGGTAGRVIIERDGFVLDPYDASVFDLSRIPLVELDEVTVERRTNVLRIRLRTTEPRDARPYSRVEAALARPEVNVFHGLFLAPRLALGPLGVAVDRIDTVGNLGSEPADAFSTWVQWGWIRERAGVQLEYHVGTFEREPDSPSPERHRRSDLVVRARGAFAEGLVGEAYVGSTSTETESLVRPTAMDTMGPARFERSGRQIGVRAALDRANLRLEGAARLRTHEEQPRFESDVGLDIRASDLLTLRADATHQRWPGDASASELGLRAAAGPIGGMLAFAELATGERGAPRFPLDTVTVSPGPVITHSTSMRIGAEARFRALSGGAAFVSVRTDSVGAFGLPFDSLNVRYRGGDVQGWEGFARADLFGGRLAAWVNYRNWLSGARWAYLSSQTWSTGITLNWVPLESGNLELTGYLAANHRGVIGLPSAMQDGTLTDLAARTIINGELTVRIIDLRILLRYEDWSAQGLEDLPGRTVLGPRFYYGVKWFFFN